MQKFRLITLTISLISLGVISANTLASGTYNAGGSSGGNDYHMAKLIFFKKVVCSSCPYPGRGKSVDDAQALLQEMSQANKLSSKEQQASISYLNRRFKLN